MERRNRNPHSMRVGPHDSLRTSNTQTRSILLLVSDYRIYQDFAEWVISSVKSEGECILHVLFNGAVAIGSDESQGILDVLNIVDIRGCENEMEMTKGALDALSRIERYDKIFFDPLSPLSQLFSDDAAPAYVLKELLPFLERRRTLGYFCLSVDSHENETIAQCKDLADVCLQVTQQDEAMVVQVINARGVYARDFFSPHVYKNWPTIDEQTEVAVNYYPTIKSAVGID